MISPYKLVPQNIIQKMLPKQKKIEPGFKKQQLVIELPWAQKTPTFDVKILQALSQRRGEEILILLWQQL